MNYATTDSSIGRLLVAATERGICAVSIGEDDAALEQSLTAEYPRATIRRDDEALRPYVDSVFAYLRAIGRRSPHCRSMWRGRRFNTRSGRLCGPSRLGSVAPTAR